MAVLKLTPYFSQSVVVSHFQFLTNAKGRMNSCGIGMEAFVTLSQLGHAVEQWEDVDCGIHRFKAWGIMHSSLSMNIVVILRHG